MKYLGMSCILAAAFFFCRRYANQKKTATAQLTGILAFLKYFRQRIDCFAMPFSEGKNEFSDPAFDVCGWTEDLRQSETAEAFFARIAPTLCMKKEAVRLWEDVCLHFGQGYVENEVRALDGVISQFESWCAADREEADRSIRLCRTLTVSAAMGLILLLS